MAKSVQVTIPKVESIMTKHVIYVVPETPLEQVAKTLVDNNIGSVPVIIEQKGKRILLGFISEKDCMRGITNNLFYGFPKPSTAEAIMVRNPVTIAPGADVLRLEQLFDQHNLRHVPVVDDDDHLLGMVSRRDVLSAMADVHDRIKKLSQEQRDGIKMNNPAELSAYMKHISEFR
jgi:predicted transcriptional regulator